MSLKALEIEREVWEYWWRIHWRVTAGVVGFVRVYSSSTTMLGGGFLVLALRGICIVSQDRSSSLWFYISPMFGGGGGFSLRCVICYDAMFAQKGEMIIWSL